jgi:hypothetical protein
MSANAERGQVYDDCDENVIDLRFSMARARSTQWTASRDEMARRFYRDFSVCRLHCGLPSTQKVITEI